MQIWLVAMRLVIVACLSMFYTPFKKFEMKPCFLKTAFGKYLKVVFTAKSMISLLSPFISFLPSPSITPYLIKYTQMDEVCWFLVFCLPACLKLLSNSSTIPLLLSSLLV